MRATRTSWLKNELNSKPNTAHPTCGFPIFPKQKKLNQKIQLDGHENAHYDEMSRAGQKQTDWATDRKFI